LEGEDAFNPSSLFQIPPCEDDALPFLDDFKYSNFGSKSNVINSFNQSIALGKNHFDDDESIEVSDEKYPRAPVYLLVSHEDFNLDVIYHSAKEDAFIETSTSHYPLCSTIGKASTCARGTP